MTPSGGPPLDVLVIGGGQAGLALGHHLAPTGLRFLIVDAGDRGRARVALPLGFAAAVHPGPVRQPARLPFPAAADTYPGKDDVADYLERYAKEFQLPMSA